MSPTRDTAGTLNKEPARYTECVASEGDSMRMGLAGNKIPKTVGLTMSQWQPNQRLIILRNNKRIGDFSGYGYSSGHENDNDAMRPFRS
ncbi:hypothetical protein GCM10023156_00610 [Novipirellula rosea]|uniref:Uncharacterized protein n=1 Tax=Novipirellula rosea TaxID=1031540 RepID=A0ABP8M5R0_9BACT